MSVESYKHKAAKRVFKSWLEEADNLLYRHTGAYMETMKIDYYCRWPKKIAEEFPITISNSRLGDATIYEGCYRDVYWWNGDIPTYDELKQKEEPVFAILDLAVGFDCGETIDVPYGFEIVHANAISPAKAEFLDTLNMTICEIDAEWILSQVAVPKSLRIRNIYGHEFWERVRQADRMRADALGGALPR